MKHPKPDSHLTDDELLQTIIDPSDLATARQAHFQSCPDCRRQSEDLKYRFSRLGRMAKQMAPKPRKVFRAPAHHAPIGPWYLKPALAMGVLGALVFVFTLWGPRFFRMVQTPPPMVAQNVEKDDHLMEEIDTLVENALPEKYQQLAALADDRSVEDLDEFIDWVVPSLEEPDDGEPSATQYLESRQEPLAWSNSAVHAERGVV